MSEPRFCPGGFRVRGRLCGSAGNRCINECAFSYLETHKAKPRFEVQHHTLCDGWTNTWSDGDGKPMTFATREEAQAEIDEFLDDINAEIRDGERDEGDGYSADEFQIVEIEP